MDEIKRSRLDQLLDLLADEVAERLRRKEEAVEGPTLRQMTPQAIAERLERREQAAEDLPVREMAPSAVEEPPEEEVLREPEPPVEPEPEPEVLPPSAGPSHSAARLIGRLALAILFLVVLVNIPLNRHGVTLATAMPDSASLAIRDGLVVKEEGEAEIYVYQDGKFRWISSMEAFEHYGFTWDDVRIVEPGFLDDFQIGPPLHVLLKCHGSPHIYRLEEGRKRWIVDIETFEAEGHVWEDVRFVPCDYLAQIPDGETIPPGHGPPPQP